MSKLTAIIAFALCLPLSLRAQIQKENKFTIRITAVKRANGCSAEATSEKVRYKLTSNVSAACAMLAAGNEYKAYRTTEVKNPKDESKDTAVLVIFNNVSNTRRAKAVFNIASEEVVNLQPCPKNDPLGLNVTGPCQPLAPGKDK